MSKPISQFTVTNCGYQLASNESETEFFIDNQDGERVFSCYEPISGETAFRIVCAIEFSFQRGEGHGRKELRREFQSLMGLASEAKQGRSK